MAKDLKDLKNLKLLFLLMPLTAAALACGESSGPAPAPTEAASSTEAPVITTAAETPTTEETPAATTSPPAAEAPGPARVCGGPGDGFVSGGLVTWLGSANGDSSHISGIFLEQVEECERLRVVLTTAGGAPATVPPLVEVELIPEAGLLRARFDPEVWSTSVTDTLLEGDLVDRVYVVRGLDGRKFVDVHLAAGVDARAMTGDDPSHMIIDFRRNGTPLAARPAVSRFAVVTDPVGGEASYPILAIGYARTFEANVLGFVAKEGVAGETYFTSAADYIVTWGEFLLQVEDGPIGEAVLNIGEYDAADGAWEGVEVNLVIN